MCSIVVATYLLNSVQREFDSAISAARRVAEMAQKRIPRVARDTFLRIRRLHVEPFLKLAS
jgi:hypothetical protein